MKKTIVYLHPHFTLPGGAGRYALETARVLAQRGWAVHMASIAYEPSLIAAYRNQITFHTLGGPLSDSVWYWTNLPRLLRAVRTCISEIQPDVVFSQVFPANWWGFIAARNRSRPWRHIWMCQEPSAFIHSKRWIQTLPWNAPGVLARLGNPVLRYLDTSFAHNVDYVLGNSEFTRQQALNTYDYSPTRVGISYPGVDISRFTPAPNTSRDSFTFVTCARLTKFKNIDKILGALSLITDPRVRLTVIGKGEEYQALCSLAEVLRLGERVKFAQTVSDEEMIREFQSSVALVHAAEEEPFGLTPVEAMACGTPVIAMRGGGPAETVVDGETGYLCASADENQIKDAMLRVVNDIQSGIYMQMACRARAEIFTWEHATDAIEKAYQACL
jgi:glycosyltransferase involved in cell wall biosynthesis